MNEGGTFLQPIPRGWEPREGGQSEELVTELESGCERKITDTHTIMILIMILGQTCVGLLLKVWLHPLLDGAA